MIVGTKVLYSDDKCKTFTFGKVIPCNEDESIFIEFEGKTKFYHRKDNNNAVSFFNDLQQIIEMNVATALLKIMK